MYHTHVVIAYICLACILVRLHCKLPLILLSYTNAFHDGYTNCPTILIFSPCLLFIVIVDVVVVVLQGPTPDAKVKVAFSNFDLENVSGCPNDKVVITGTNPVFGNGGVVCANTAQVRNWCQINGIFKIDD